MFHLWHHHNCAERRGSCALHKALPNIYIFKKNTPSAPCRAVRVCGDCAAPSILSALRRQVLGETGYPRILSCPPLTGACSAAGPRAGLEVFNIPPGPVCLSGRRQREWECGFCAWRGSSGEVTLRPLSLDTF